MNSPTLSRRPSVHTVHLTSRKILFLAASLGLVFAGAGCSEGSADSGLPEVTGESGDPSSELLKGGQTGDEFGLVIQTYKGAAPRELAAGPQNGTASEELATFAWEFYGRLGQGEANFVYSPYSIYTAAGMLYAGAAGETQAQMQRVFSFADEGPAFHQAQNELLQYLDERNVAATDRRNAQTLRVTNDFWMAERFTPRFEFLNTLSAYYDAPVYVWKEPLDEVRLAINKKISDDTNALIPELLPPDVPDANTLFVLTNALYFKSRWATEFELTETATADFTEADGTTGKVEMMHGGHLLAGYRKVAEAEVISIPYSGNELEYVAIMPNEGEFDAYNSTLTAPVVATLTEGMSEEVLDLHFPKMEIDDKRFLKEDLWAAGMVDAFDGSAADFSALADKPLWIDEVIHQTHLILNEEGTEAAAATAIVGPGSGPPPTPIEVTFDRPFVFFIRDIETQAVLFVGHYSQAN